MKNVADIYALSPMQKLMLLHANTSGTEHDVLFNQIVFQITGQLDTEAYRKAWQLMIDRHPALRTMFIWQDSKEPLQIVREKLRLPWKEVDWCTLSPCVQQNKLDRLLADDRGEGFDLLRPPLMRLTLIRIADNRHWLVWSSHHLVVDRWCISIIFEELNSAYEAYRVNISPKLAPAPRYSDYIAWLSKQDENKARVFWREILADLQSKSLTVKAAKSDEPPDPKTMKTVLAGETWAALRQFALHGNVTPSVLVSAAWALVLSSATGNNDTLLGLTVSGRPAELTHVERTIGCFINNVPLRIPCQADQSLIPWLQAIQDRQLSLQAVEYASLAQIQTWSELKTRGPLFDTLLVLQAPVEIDNLSGLKVELFRDGTQSGYPISVSAVPHQDRLELEFTYDPSLVPQDMIQQMSSALENILRAMPEYAGAQLQELLDLTHIDLPKILNAGSKNEQRVNSRPFIPSRTTAEQALVHIWAEVLDLPRVGIEDKFYELGGDSLKALQLLTLVEQRFGKDLPISLLFRDPTVAEMAEALGGDTQTLPKDPVLVPINQNGTRSPVFFTHGVLGGLLWLKHIAPLLEPDQPVYGLQSVGLQPGYEPDSTIEAMAARFVKTIQTVQPSGPYYLGGFCFGGILAYEIARQLEELGQETALLIVIDGFPPSLFQNEHGIINAQRVQIIRQSVPSWIQVKKLRSLDLRNKIATRFNSRRNGRAAEGQNLANAGVDHSVSTTRESQRRLRQINRAAGAQYIPQAYGGKVTLFRAQQIGVRDALFGPVDPQRGWDKLAQSGVVVRNIDSTHVGLLTPPSVSALAAQLNEELGKASSSSG